MNGTAILLLGLLNAALPAVTAAAAGEEETHRESTPCHAPAVNTVEATVDGRSTISYLLAARKPNGAFGPHDQTYTDLAWNYPAVHALKILGVTIDRKNENWSNGRHPVKRDLEWNFYLENQLAALLGRNHLRGSPKEITEEGELDLRSPRLLGNNLQNIWYSVASVRAFGGMIDNGDELLAAIRRRQLPGGGYADEKDVTGFNEDDAHVIWTFYAVMSLTQTGQPVPDREKTIRWLQSCQSPGGGFKYSPGNNSPGNYADIWYTWAAVRALQALGSEPADKAACIAWINSLQNHDGGFADQPGWRSRIFSTYYAVHALEALTGNALQAITAKRVAQPDPAPIPEGVYTIYSAHHKGPADGGDPHMVEEVVRKLRFHFYGMKTYQMADVERARSYAAARNYPVELVKGPELHSHNLIFEDGRKGNHAANFIYPPGMSPEEQRIFNEADRWAGEKPRTWRQYQEKVIRPLQRIGTVFYPEHDRGQEQGGMLQAYYQYDDGVYGRGGYNAVHAVHNTGPDRIRLYPWRERYLTLLPFIADGDAHGTVDTWRPTLESIRVLYLSTDSYRYPDYLKALDSGMSVAVLKENTNNGPKLTYYGDPKVVDYVQRHLHEWKWW